MPEILSTYSIIDVLTAFDVEEILRKNNNALSSNPSAATSLGNNPDTVYMITTLANAAYGYGQGPKPGTNQGEGGSNLRILANVNDVIRWRTVSLTDTADYKCFLYSFKAIGTNRLGEVSYITANVAEPYPASGWPGNNQVKEELRADYYAQATVLSPGDETYTFVVAIYDRHAQLKGYVTWDPYISINSR
ncbi:AidA/PixA family protein [Burkholderia ambifaria]|uniref:Inclusion body protein n=2 Tax=Burkholderia ambifaria TaxID=152480 RepID=A0AA41E2Z8_9BURK|nr:AidA/PixA family protein [Burkholderia ambifaria]EDT06278.1 conserved hypothetical protein [Burkholderia ambifaria IOP40-10]MBR8127460.1 hypothetical protein [Burkholderia ambifaria]MBR8181601.1 hypothetical protein [Burkholderia ambifaria]NHL67865.1 hypothetical protein [Burkholderia ambifaria]PRD95926.1 hypothetical protein C6P77_26060 [Burkholderia ambifaria]